MRVLVSVTFTVVPVEVTSMFFKVLTLQLRDQIAAGRRIIQPALQFRPRRYFGIGCRLVEFGNVFLAVQRNRYVSHQTGGVTLA